MIVISTEEKTKVQELLTQGWTQAKIAEHMGIPVHRVTYLARVLDTPRRTRGQPRKDGGATVRRKTKPKPELDFKVSPAPAVSDDDGDALEPAPLSDDVDALGLVRALMASARRDYDRAAKSHDAGNATKFARIAAQLTPVLARLEKSTKEDGDVIKIPRDQLESKRKELCDKLRLLTADLPRCVDCGRALRVSWGGDD